MSFSWSFISLNTGGKKSRKEQFLEEMEDIIPWKELVEIIEEFWNNKKLGRKKTPALLLLKIHFLQKWYHLADLSVEEEIWDRRVFQKFLDIDAGKEGVPDATTIENFRHCLENNDVSQKIFQRVWEILVSQNLILQEWTSVDASIISAPSSTKNKERKRDPEMKQTKKWNQWYFWMKIHCGTDSTTWLIHTLKTSSANEHDSLYFEDCLHGNETVVFADRAYRSRERIQKLRKQGITSCIQLKARKWETLSKKQKKENRKRSGIRALCEHPFHTIKYLWGWNKVVYKWLKKNTEHFFMLSALSNLHRVRYKIQDS